MTTSIPPVFLDMLVLTHASWRPILRRGLDAMANADPTYLPALAQDTYLPTDGRLFAAFAQPLEAVRYVLVGEGPYPRPESATGLCFMDGAVDALWSDKGFSKQVNRATSLRNFMKMLLVADKQLIPGQTGSEAMESIAAKARAAGSPFIQTRTELEANLARHGFLLLNAALVFRPHVPPLKEARAWQPFLQTVLAALADQASEHRRPQPTLVLWGKIAEQLNGLPPTNRFRKVASEHPYNLSFIASATMQDLFEPMHLLQTQAG
ncbi:MAG TPA: uracil-DNA glycosylase family protein [Burkholderiaceae bacterium]|nr:uracil-DNA glycosylase family protein [Burkholderiaceae bacterium]